MLRTHGCWGPSGLWPYIFWGRWAGHPTNGAGAVPGATPELLGPSKGEGNTVRKVFFPAQILIFLEDVCCPPPLRGRAAAQADFFPQISQKRGGLCAARRISPRTPLPAELLHAPLSYLARGLLQAGCNRAAIVALSTPRLHFGPFPRARTPPSPLPGAARGVEELSCCSSPRPSEGGSFWVFFFASQLPSKPPCRMQGAGGDRHDCPHDVDTKLKGVKTGKGRRRCGFLSQYGSHCRSLVVLGDNGIRMAWGRRPGGDRGVAAAATR